MAKFGGTHKAVGSSSSGQNSLLSPESPDILQSNNSGSTERSLSAKRVVSNSSESTGGIKSDGLGTTEPSFFYESDDSGSSESPVVPKDDSSESTVPPSIYESDNSRSTEKTEVVRRMTRNKFRYMNIGCAHRNGDDHSDDDDDDANSSVSEDDRDTELNHSSYSQSSDSGPAECDYVYHGYADDSIASSFTSFEESPESSESDDTEVGPELSPVLSDFDPESNHDEVPPGEYPLTIGWWVIPTRGGGLLSSQNIVRPRIDAAGRLGYYIQEERQVGGPIELPLMPGSQRARLRASEALLFTNLPAPVAARGYFEFLPRYAANVSTARDLIRQDIAANIWSSRQLEQRANHLQRIQEHGIRPPPPQTRTELNIMRAAETRRLSRRMTRRQGIAGLRRARRRLARRWARRTERYRASQGEHANDDSS